MLSRWGDVPDPMPVVLAGRPPADASGDDFTLVGLGGRPVASRAVEHVDALPAVTDHGALADLDAQLRVGGEMPAGSHLQVWLGTEDATVVRSVSAALLAAGLPVTSTTTVSEARAEYDRSATGWGLLLGVFTGLVALLVSCLVVGLVAVTSWRGVARDLAGLLVAGTPRAVLRSAVRREQLATVLAGVALGTLCGVAGAVLAMPLLPLFDRPAGRAGARPHAGLARHRGDRARRAGAGGRRGARRRPQRRLPRGARAAAGVAVSGVRVVTRGLVHIYRAEGHDVAALSGRRPRRRAGGAAGPARAVRAPASRRCSPSSAGCCGPSAGRVLVGEHEMGRLSEAELDPVRGTEIGMVLQGAARNLLPYLSARGNVAFAQARRPPPRAGRARRPTRSSPSSACPALAPTRRSAT